MFYAMSKTIIQLTVTAVLALLMPDAAFAQSTAKQVKKERTEQQNIRKAMRKTSEKELNTKATKEARKEAKRLKKEGWTIAPGTLPLEKQLDRSYLLQYEFTADNTPKYIMAEGMSTAGSYDAAKLQATELAKLNLVSQMQSEINAIIENTVANEQLTDGEASTLTRTVAASKNTFSQKLGRVHPVVETYRDKGNKKEVLVRVAYDLDNARVMAIESIREELKNEGEALHEKLDEIFPR